MGMSGTPKSEGVFRGGWENSRMKWLGYDTMIPIIMSHALGKLDDLSRGFSKMVV